MYYGVEDSPAGADGSAVGANEAGHAVEGQSGQGQRGRVEKHQGSW